MAFEYEVTTLPPVWPGERHAMGKRSPFKTQWTRTLELLGREVRQLGGTHAQIAIDLPRGDYDLTKDGRLRADARPKRAVILSFRTSEGHRLQFPCDTYAFWQDNVYAIAMTLEKLRAIDRYGATSHKQYEGFKALPSQSSTMDVHEAGRIVGMFSDASPLGIVANPDVARSSARAAVFRTHPDRNNGKRADYDRVELAKRVLSSHHGVSL